MTAVVNYPRGTEEYVKATLTADVTLDATVTVALSLSTGNNSTGYTHTWLVGEWEGTDATTRVARTSSTVVFSTANYPLRSYRLFAKLTDSPEVPFIDCGAVTVGA